MISAVKWVSWSELTLKGSPNFEKIWFINRQAVVFAVSLGAGRHSIHFLNLQTMVRKYLLPRVDHGRGPTQSIWRSDHGKLILSFAVVLGGLDLLVGTGSTPGNFLRIPLRLAACQAIMLIA